MLFLLIHKCFGLCAFNTKKYMESKNITENKKLKEKNYRHSEIKIFSQ
jgi:hypothetical protein